MIAARGAYRVGDALVYREAHYAAKPESAAANLVPDMRGEGYRYTLTRLLTVIGVLGDGNLICRAKDGETLTLAPDCPDLRRRTLWDRLVPGSR